MRSFQPPPPSSHTLAFRTADTVAAITTDFGLRLVAVADEGQVVLCDRHDIPSVDECMTSVLKAVVDTAARGKAAAVFVALSGAWERALREWEVREGEGRERNAEDGGNVANLRRRNSGGVANGSSNALRTSGERGTVRNCLSQALERANLKQSTPALVDALLTPEDEWSESKFRLHPLPCSLCHKQPITGTRYHALNLNLCEPCRRLDIYDVGFLIYEHPWEARDTNGGEEEPQSTPVPPLEMGDVGVSVMHLQYMLYRLGYLGRGAFRVGVFCGGTREGVERFGGGDGVYGGDMRGGLGVAWEEMMGGVRCGSKLGGGARLRTALAA